jgi:peptide/nickel transport system ATP-binding protein
VISFAAHEPDPATDAPSPRARKQPAKAERRAERPAAVAEVTPAKAIEGRARPKVQASKAMTGRPGDSAPKKSLTEVGDGRQAASEEVKPATARKPREKAAAKGQAGQQPLPIKTASSPEEARRMMGVPDPEPKPGRRRNRQPKA